jgi:adenylate kinase
LSELNLILLGPPGAGKGTQAQRLKDDFRLPYIATGDMLREAGRKGTELGRKTTQFLEAGDLVPDDLITEVILDSVRSDEAKDGFLLDGFPRTEGQADALDEGLKELGRHLTAVLAFELPDDEVVRRLAGRRVCVKAGHTYHVEFDPPKHPDVCDQDGSRLVQRDDDREETIRKRLDVYHRQTAPLVERYDQQGLLRPFDAARSQTEVHDHVRATLATLRLEDRL